VFFSVARGKVAEGIDFDRHYGRAVLLFGIPYQYTLSHVLKARLNFMREKYFIKDNDFLTFDALRQSAQCIGRIIRSKTDYGIVILADIRYNRNDKRSKFPPWILHFLKETGLNISTDIAIDQIKTFLKHVGQPMEDSALKTILLDEKQIEELNRKKQFSFGGVVQTPRNEQRIKEEPGTDTAAMDIDDLMMSTMDAENPLQTKKGEDDLMEAEEDGYNEEDWKVLHEMEADEILKQKSAKKEINTVSLDIPSISIEKIANKYNSLFLFGDD